MAIACLKGMLLLDINLLWHSETMFRFQIRPPIKEIFSMLTLGVEHGVDVVKDVPLKKP